MNTQQLNRLIDQGAELNIARIIDQSIKDNKSERDRLIGLFNRYKGDVPINKRTIPDITKVNEKLANDFRGEVVEQITGFMFGKPISYVPDKNVYTSEFDMNRINEAIRRFNFKNNISDLDHLTGTMQAVCGKANRLLYIDKNGEVRAMNIKPWECIVWSDSTIDETCYALIYYEYQYFDGAISKTRTKAEFYDMKNIYFYTTDDLGHFMPDIQDDGNYVKPHMFSEVPVIEFVNNDLRQGDFEKVESLIDSYDILLSDAQNEIESFRLAYLLFLGMVPTDEEIEAAKKTGAFATNDKEVKVQFLTKDINVELIEAQKKTIEKNIYKFSQTVDMSDEKFSGSGQSGESRKWKLVGLANRAINKERKFIKGLQEQYELICSVWNMANIPLRPENMKFIFTRNLPVDLNSEAETTMKLKGMISDRTRLGLLSFIEDPDQELDQMEQEAGEMLNLDNVIPMPDNNKATA